MTTMITLLALIGTAEAGRGGNGGGGGGGGTPDLAVTVSAPAKVDVDAPGSISVEVTNHGSATANSVDLVILLPETATSPSVHVLGALSNIDSRCAPVGTTLECSLGRIRKGQSATVSFDFAAPWADVDLDIDAVASTSGETALSDNLHGVTLDVAYVDFAISGPAAVSNRHCTGTGLTAFYECELFPSSISGHEVQFEATGSITFGPGVTGYTGAWWQDTDDHLHFEYYLNGDTVMAFDGNGVGGDTFEGITTFPGSPYNAAYEVSVHEL